MSSLNGLTVQDFSTVIGWCSENAPEELQSMEAHALYDALCEKYEVDLVYPILTNKYYRLCHTVLCTWLGKEQPLNYLNTISMYDLLCIVRDKPSATDFIQGIQRLGVDTFDTLCTSNPTTTKQSLNYHLRELKNIWTWTVTNTSSDELREIVFTELGTHVLGSMPSESYVYMLESGKEGLSQFRHPKSLQEFATIYNRANPMFMPSLELVDKYTEMTDLKRYLMDICGLTDTKVGAILTLIKEHNYKEAVQLLRWCYRDTMYMTVRESEMLGAACCVVDYLCVKHCKQSGLYVEFYVLDTPNDRTVRTADMISILKGNLSLDGLLDRAIVKDKPLSSLIKELTGWSDTAIIRKLLDNNSK